MNIASIKTPKITVNGKSLIEIINDAIPDILENSVIAITSKIVSICEGRVIPTKDIDKEDLVIKESDLYLPASLSKYGHHFTITNNTLIPMAGVDESNGEGYYILWPKDSQKTANDIRHYLQKKHGLTNLGIVITDSTCQPLRRGTTGIALAHSGFLALRNYIGTPDIFGRPFGVTQANLAGGIAAAAVLAMGEGSEQTPLCLVSDLSGITFQDSNPTREEIDELYVPLQEDLFAPFLTAVEWSKGDKK
jgi:putative folate metabolism gamma-glutamate ligase